MLAEIRHVTKGKLVEGPCVQLVYKTDDGQPDGLETYTGEMARLLLLVANFVERKCVEELRGGAT